MEYDKLNQMMLELRILRKLHVQLMTKACQDITPDQGRLLFAIKNKKMSQKELAKQLHITEATLSVRIKRLLDAGLIERKNDGHDKRVYKIVLSKKGEQLTTHMEDAIEHYKKMITKGVTLEEYEMIMSVIRKLQDNLKEGIK